MTDERSTLISLALADDADYFALLRGIPKSECNRCKTGENVTPGPVIPDSEGVRRREMRCTRCDFGWSVVVGGEVP